MFFAIARNGAVEGNLAVDVPLVVEQAEGTLARRLAEHYGLAYLDSGSLYRGTALSLLRERDQ